MIELADSVNTIIVFRVQKSLVACTASILRLNGLNQHYLPRLLGRHAMAQDTTWYCG